MKNATQAMNTAQKPLLPRWSDLSLRAKLVLILLMVALIPLLMAVLINGASARQAALRAADQNLLGSAESIADQIDRVMQVGLDSARYQAHLPIVIAYAQLPAEQRMDSPEEESLLDFMLTASYENPVYVTSIAVLDAQGTTLLDTSAAEVGVSSAERAYFRQAMESGLPSASSVEYDHVTGKPSLYFIAPVQNADDEIIGALRIRYDALILQDLISKNNGRAGEGSFAMLLDENRLYLAHGADKQSLYKSVIPLSKELAGELQAQRLLPPGDPASMQLNLAEFENGLVNFPQQPTFSAGLQDGETQQIALAKVGDRNWIAAFAQPQAIVLAPVNAQIRNNFLIAVVIAVGVAFFGLLLAEALAASIIRLTESKAALMIAETAPGRLEEEIPAPAAPEAIPVLFEQPLSVAEEADGAPDVKVQTAVAAPASVVTEQKQAKVPAKTSPRKARPTGAPDDQLEVAIQRLGMILRAARVSAEGERKDQP